MLAPVLSHYFSCAFELGVFPHYFETAKVIPVFKSGNKILVSNYRPISLFTILSKVLEKLIKGRLVKFFDKHNIWYEYQYGFREKHSVSHALLDVSSLCYDSIQNKLHTAMLFMDLRKAFDTVSPEILLHKLYHYGIRGPALSLITSYLSSRKQYVSINNVNSSSKMIKIGVPQGSILSSLRFLIYVNDLFNATLTKPRLFADDTCFVISDSSPSILELQMQPGIAKRLQLVQRKQTANKSRKILHNSYPFQIKSPPPFIDLNVYYIDFLVSCRETCKYLRVYLDFKLNFLHHIRQVESKVTQAVGILSKLRSLLPKSTLLLLYHALIHPHLIYALSFWGCTFSSYLQKASAPAKQSNPDYL